MKSLPEAASVSVALNTAEQKHFIRHRRPGKFWNIDTCRNLHYNLDKTNCGPRAMDIFVDSVTQIRQGKKKSAFNINLFFQHILIYDTHGDFKKFMENKQLKEINMDFRKG